MNETEKFFFSALLDEFSNEKTEEFIVNNKPLSNTNLHTIINPLKVTKKCPNYVKCKGFGNKKKSFIKHRTLASCPKRELLSNNDRVQVNRSKTEKCINDEQLNIMSKKYECLSQKYLRICNKIMFFKRKSYHNETVIKK